MQRHRHTLILLLGLALLLAASDAFVPAPLAPTAAAAAVSQPAS